MARPSVAARNFSQTEELERLEQSITLTLQEIDHNFSKAHRIVTASILPVVEQYGENSKAIWEASKFWKQFFEASANVSLSGYEELANDESTVMEESTAMHDDGDATIHRVDSMAKGHWRTAATMMLTTTTSLRLDDSDDEGEDEDGIILPEPTRAQAKVIDTAAAQQLAASNPALDGAIPIAIFDISCKQAFFKPDVAERFFFMLAPFRALPAHNRIAQHVLDTLTSQFPNDPVTASCLIRQPIAGVSPLTADFPRGLREVLPRLTQYLAASSDREALVRKTEAWIDECLAVEGLDEAIKTVLEHTKASLVAKL
ncbi:hypothetical protein NQ176_g3632 [Zarea fungicola]|uniref:Uncharacterized protein n=1 Tax=Zarea fungicola TaxID=93591 RepID=A0ACC1NJR8_9HYPO|nr:hypothetical protein NQ176_g3632 [Lecanicillium fungicola]